MNYQPGDFVMLINSQQTYDVSGVDFPYNAVVEVIQSGDDYFKVISNNEIETICNCRICKGLYKLFLRVEYEDATSDASIAESRSDEDEDVI